MPLGGCVCMTWNSYDCLSCYASGSEMRSVSTVLSLSSGVSQGSFFGPLHFLIYANDFPYSNLFLIFNLPSPAFFVNSTNESFKTRNQVKCITC